MLNRILVALCLLLVSCSSTYHKKETLGGGYQDQAVGPKTYRVEYFGSMVTQPETVYHRFLRRCAELTLEKGYRRFSFEDQEGGLEAHLFGTKAFRKQNTESPRVGTIRVYGPEDDAPEESLDAKQVLEAFQGE